MSGFLFNKGALVQKARMPHCHCGGHGFEPRTHRSLACVAQRQSNGLLIRGSGFRNSPQALYGGLAQSARAPALQAGGRGFESLCLHHYWGVAKR